MARIVDVAQGTPEWLEARTGIATASRFADIMARGKDGRPLASRQSYATELALERVTGEKIETFQSQAMQDGVALEPHARQMYEARTGRIVVETGLWLHDTLPCGASPDGLVDDDGLIEIKCPQPKQHLSYMQLPSGSCPPQYWWQIQGQLWITGRSWCDFVSFNPRFPDGARLVVRRVQRNRDAIERLASELEAFLGDVEQSVVFINSYKE